MARELCKRENLIELSKLALLHYGRSERGRKSVRGGRGREEMVLRGRGGKRLSSFEDIYSKASRYMANFFHGYCRSLLPSGHVKVSQFIFRRAGVENRLSFLFFFCQTYSRADLCSHIFSPSIPDLVRVQGDLSITLLSNKLFLASIPFPSWYAHPQ